MTRRLQVSTYRISDVFLMCQNNLNHGLHLKQRQPKEFKMISKKRVCKVILQLIIQLEMTQCFCITWVNPTVLIFVGNAHWIASHWNKMWIRGVKLDHNQLVEKKHNSTFNTAEGNDLNDLCARLNNISNDSDQGKLLIWHNLKKIARMQKKGTESYLSKSKKKKKKIVFNHYFDKVRKNIWYSMYLHVNEWFCGNKCASTSKAQAKSKQLVFICMYIESIGGWLIWRKILYFYSTIFKVFSYLLICRSHCCIGAKVGTFRISFQLIYFVTIWF